MIGRSSGALALLVVAAGGGAQSPCLWTPAGLPESGVSGEVRALAAFDDGTGPKLVLAGAFLWAGNRPANRIATWDGASFAPLGSGVGGGVNALAVFYDGTGPALYAGGSFSTAGGQLAVGVARWDGTAWSPVGGGTDEIVHALANYDDGTGPALYAGGVFTHAGGVPCNHIARWNGSAWTPVAGGLGGPVFALAVHNDGGGPALHAGGVAAFGPVGGAFVARYGGGAAWTPVLSGPGGGFFPAIRALTSFDDSAGPRLFAGGLLTMPGSGAPARVAAWNGSAWTDISANVNGYVAALAVHDDGGGAALYLGGSGVLATAAASPLVRWNGASWSQVLPLGTAGSSIATLLSTGLGAGPTLAFGGVIDHAGDPPVRNAGEYRGGAIHELGSGPAGAVRTFADAGGAAGDFVLAASWPRVLQGSAVAWTAFGGPFALEGFAVAPAPGVEDLSVFDLGAGRELFAAGTFTSAGGVTARHVARWTGAAWAPIGGGVTAILGGTGVPPFGAPPVSPVGRDLEVFDSGGGRRLILAGAYTAVDGLPCAGPAEFDGTTWSPLGSGVLAGTNPFIEKLLVFDDGTGPGLIAAGNFTAVGGVAAAGIARFDGVGWWPLGTGVTGTVRALEVFDDGGGPALYAAGSLTAAGGMPVTNVARWNGSAWAAAGAGVLFAVRDLAVFDDGGGPALFAAGSAGASVSGVTARFRGGVWTPVGAGLWSAAVIQDLTVVNDGGIPRLYASGTSGLFGAGSPAIARYGCTAGPSLSMTQSGGAAQPVRLRHVNLLPGREYATIFSFELCPAGPGTGPWAGLCAADPGVLIGQLSYPLGTLPFHFLAAGTGLDSGPYALPPLAVDGVCLDITGGSLQASSPAVRLIVH